MEMPHRHACVLDAHCSCEYTFSCISLPLWLNFLDCLIQFSDCRKGRRRRMVDPFSQLQFALSLQMVNSSAVGLSIISGMLSNFSPSSETIDHSSFSPILGGWYTLGYATSSIPDCFLPNRLPRGRWSSRGTHDIVASNDHSE